MEDLLFKNYPHCSVIIDQCGDIIKSNIKAEQLFPRLFTENKSFFEIINFNPEQLPGLVEAIDKKEFYLMKNFSFKFNNYGNSKYDIEFSRYAGNRDFLLACIHKSKEEVYSGNGKENYFKEFIDSLDKLPLMFMVLNHKLEIISYNEYAARELFLPESSNYNRHKKIKFLDLIDQTNQNKIKQSLQEVVLNTCCKRTFCQITDNKGFDHTVEVIFLPHKVNSIGEDLKLEAGVTIKIFCLISDITDFKQKFQSRMIKENQGWRNKIQKHSDELAEANHLLKQEIEKRKAIESELRIYAATDVLTGIYNRRTGLLFLENRMKLSKREESHFVICFVDVNDLKKINDKFGHNEGDELIICISQILKKSIRESDIVFRLGGDEFIVIFQNTDIEKSELLWNRIQENIDFYNKNTEKKYDISLSFGFAEYDPRQNSSIEELIAFADQEMYKYKKKFYE
ncbi:MAG: hypothetical protein APR63_05575 [Desulfuromonas sp. SDB]|nr:MAG: hypothetical protein APR63_05575 [Desulfuromonas sp. SDB]